jgi:hypothetical protein
MGAYCLLGLIPSHPAREGEIMKVLRSNYDGAVIFGDRREIACIPHTGCRLEIVATPPVSHRKVNFLLPGQVIRYKRSFFLGDRFELPGGTKVSLRHLVGFKLQLAPSLAPPPVEDVIVRRRRLSEFANHPGAPDDEHQSRDLVELRDGRRGSGACWTWWTAARAPSWSIGTHRRSSA